MRIFIALALPFLLAATAPAQQVTPQAEGGPAPDRVESIGRDAGPATQPPRTDGPQAVHRGTDGSSVGLEDPDATGTTPQGMEGDATAGATRPAPPSAASPRPAQSDRP